MKFSIDNISKDTVRLRLIGPIGDWETSGAAFTRQIDGLLSEGVQHVVMYINSPGGGMFDANEIGNQIRRFSGRKTCELGSIAASAASILSTFFDTVKARSNTQYMMHNPVMKVQMTCPQDFVSHQKIYHNLRADAIRRYAHKSGIATADIATMMDNTTWMNAQEAQQKGFVDSVESKQASVSTEDVDNLIAQGLAVPKSILNQINNMTTNQPTEQTAKSVAPLEQAQKDRANLLVALAQSKGIPTQGLQALAMSDYENTLTFVEGFPAKTAHADGDSDTAGVTAHNEIVNAIAGALKSASVAKKDWDAMSDAEKDALRESDPKSFDELFNKNYNQ